MTHPSSFSGEAGLSMLEFILILGILALTYVTVTPFIQQTRESIVVERTARNLEKTIVAIDFILNNTTLATNRTDITLAHIDHVFMEEPLSARCPPPNWPKEVDLASFNPTEPDNPAIDVILKSGRQTITTQDISSPR